MVNLDTITIFIVLNASLCHSDPITKRRRIRSCATFTRQIRGYAEILFPHTGAQNATQV